MAGYALRPGPFNWGEPLRPRPRGEQHTTTRHELGAEFRPRTEEAAPTPAAGEGGYMEAAALSPVGLNAGPWAS